MANLSVVRVVGGPRRFGYDDEVLRRQRCVPTWTVLPQYGGQDGDMQQYAQKPCPSFVGVDGGAAYGFVPLFGVVTNVCRHSPLLTWS